MSNLVLEGFPHNTKVTRLAIIFKSLLRRHNIGKFWIINMSDMRGSDLKSVTVEFHDADETQRAQKVLHRFEYRIGNDLYPINAYLEFEHPRRKSPSSYHYEQDLFGSHSRVRSRSRHYETSKLDLEIELLRKQRLIVEEERRLLLEKKKLELVKEFGPSALEEFESSEFSRARPRDYKPREPSPFEFLPKKRSRRNKPKTPPQRTPALYNKLPNFLWPCKLIIQDMKDLILRSGVKSQREVSALYKMIRITVRKRLVVLCEGKRIMSASEIVALYREYYRVTTDKVLVAKELKNLRVSHMSMEGGGEIVKGAKKDITEKQERTAKEEGVENKNGEDINEGEKSIKIEGPNEVKQEKTEKKCEVHGVTDTTDIKGTAHEIKEIKLEVTNTAEAISNENISKKEMQSKGEKTLGIEKLIPSEKPIMPIEKEIHNKEEIIPNSENVMPKEKEIHNKEEIIPNNENVMPGKVISNEEKQNEANIEKVEEKSVNLDDWIKSDSNGVVFDEANMDDWTEGDGEEWK